MTLNDWVKNGWLREHRTSAQEIANLFAVVDREIADSQIARVSPDGRLNHAYNAALQAATAALHAAGFRPTRAGGDHYRVIESLELTIGADASLVRQLDAFRKKRNADSYERAGAVSEGEVGEMNALAIQLRNDVLGWLKTNHPSLAPR